jgi:hypothetical protein
MATFVKGGGVSTPFGRNEYLRSTRGTKFESYTIAASTVPARTIDGNTGQKILQPGTVMAKITSGAESGKVGPYSTDTTGVTDGRSNPDNIVGINDTFLPWQLVERDVEIAVLTDGTVVQGWCFEYTAAGAAVPQTLSNQTVTTDAADVFNGKRLGIRFA